MLKIENLSFGYSTEKKILNGIYLSLEKGKTFALVGPSGCGKSTLLRLIAGILRAEKNFFFQGEILIDGISPVEYRKSGKFSFMFQEPVLFPNRTVVENIRLPLEILGKKEDGIINSLLKTAGLSAFKNYYPSKLSGGMKTRVALLRSLVTRPELLLLDEPFAAIDIGWKTLLYEELKKIIMEFGTTVFFVTHDIQEAIFLGDYTNVLSREGTLIHEMIFESEKKKNLTLANIPNIFGNELTVIQTEVNRESIRMNITTEEVNFLLDELERMVSIKEKYQDCIIILSRLRAFCEEEEINRKLLGLYYKADRELKVDIVWYLFLKKQEDGITQNVFYELINLKETFIENTLNFYQTKTEDLPEILIERINNYEHQVNKFRNWLYLLSFMACPPGKTVTEYLLTVIKKENEMFEYPFASCVAQEVLYVINKE